MARATVPLIQLTAAATAAWVIALQFGGHSDPFFAPIAAVVALSSPLGERGSNALRLLLGVLVGIAVGELTVLVLGGGYGRLALATFAALAITRLLDLPRLVMVQAAAGAILTVAASDGEAGVHRLIDAVIGSGVALLGSQVLFSPEPVALVRRAVSRSLARISEALTLLARSVEDLDDDLADEAVRMLRDQRDDLAELARLRKASGRVARHSAIWRHRIEPTVRETENAGHLDLLDTSCLALARAVASAPVESADRSSSTAFGRGIRGLATVLSDMAADPGDRAVRQAAADSSLAIARRLATEQLPSDPALTAAVLALRAVVIDVMAVAGVDLDEAVEAMRQGIGDFEVPTPPLTPRLPFAHQRRLRRRT